MYKLTQDNWFVQSQVIDDRGNRTAPLGDQRRDFANIGDLSLVKVLWPPVPAPSTRPSRCCGPSTSHAWSDC